MSAWFRKLPAEVYVDRISSPVGRLVMVASAHGLHALLWERDAKSAVEKAAFARMLSGRGFDVIIRAKQQLREYFAGQRKGFDLPLKLEGTDFQKKVWRELQRIPYGRTLSYGEQARRLGTPKGFRAVAGANGRNPICIIVPCHRVITHTGTIGGYGGGIKAKKLLLDLEGAKVKP